MFGDTDAVYLPKYNGTVAARQTDYDNVIGCTKKGTTIMCLECISVSGSPRCRQTSLLAALIRKVD